MTCPGCGERVDEKAAEFFTIHETGGKMYCAKCYHRREADGRPTVMIPAWVAAEIVCLLGLADGLSDLARRTSKEIGCQCGEEIGLCIYCHAQIVNDRARDVLRWLEKAGVPRA